MPESVPSTTRLHCLPKESEGCGSETATSPRCRQGDARARTRRVWRPNPRPSTSQPFRQIQSFPPPPRRPPHFTEREPGPGRGQAVPPVSGRHGTARSAESEGLGRAVVPLAERGAEGPKRPGTMPRMGTIEGGRWERALTPSHGASRVRGPRKLDQDPEGLPGRLLVSPPRARTWEPWQRWFYGGRAGPGGPRFPTQEEQGGENGQRRSSPRGDRGTPQPRPSPPPRPHLPPSRTASLSPDQLARLNKEPRDALFPEGSCFLGVPLSPPFTYFFFFSLYFI